ARVAHAELELGAAMGLLERLALRILQLAERGTRGQVEQHEGEQRDPEQRQEREQQAAQQEAPHQVPPIAATIEALAPSQHSLGSWPCHHSTVRIGLPRSTPTQDPSEPGVFAISFERTSGKPLRSEKRRAAASAGPSKLTKRLPRQPCATITRSGS